VQTKTGGSRSRLSFRQLRRIKLCGDQQPVFLNHRVLRNMQIFSHVILHPAHNVPTILICKDRCIDILLYGGPSIRRVQFSSTMTRSVADQFSHGAFGTLRLEFQIQSFVITAQDDSPLLVAFDTQHLETYPINALRAM
jgi:hypothetical protein